MATSLIPSLALLGVSFIWGTTFYLVHEALKDIAPFHFLFYRFTIASLFLGALMAAKRGRKGRLNLLHGLVAGILLFGGYAFQTIGLKYTSASKAAFITGLSVVLVPWGEALWKRKSPTFWALVSTGIAAWGMALLTLDGSLTLAYGDMLVFLCALCFAGHIIFIDRITHLNNPEPLALVQLVTVGLLSSLFLPWEPPPVLWSAAVLRAFIITSLLATSAAFLIQVRVQRKLSASATAVILSTEPVFGALTAFCLGGETLSPKQVWGCALILLSMLFVQMVARKEAISGEEPQQGKASDEGLESQKFLH